MGSAASSPRPPARNGGSLPGAGMCCFSCKHQEPPQSLSRSSARLVLLQSSSPATGIRLSPVPHPPEPGHECLTSPRAAPAHSWHSQPSWDTCPSASNQRRPWLLHRFHVPRLLCAFLLWQGKEPAAWCWAAEPGCGDMKLAPLRGLAPVSGSCRRGVCSCCELEHVAGL